MKRALQIVGALSLVAWTGLGLFAWDRARSGVHLTVTEGESGSSEELALLGDRLDTVSEDLRSLVGSLEGNFGLLVEELERSSATPGRDAAALDERLQRHEAQVSAALEHLEALVVASRIESPSPLAGAIPAASPDEALSLSEPEVAVSAPARSTSAAADEPAAEIEPAPEPEAAPEAAPPAKRSFLAFSLPSTEFEFSGEQRFEVLASLSRVGFDAKSTLHDFSGASDQVSGWLTVDLADPEASIDGSIRVASRTLDTGLEGRDEAMWEHLDTAHHDTIEFVPTGFESATVDVAAQRVEGVVLGRMTIRGVTRDVRVPIKVGVDSGRRLELEGETALSLPDYEIPVPNQLGVISVEEEVKVWLRLRLRARKQGAAR